MIIFYEEIKEFYTLYLLFMAIGIGLFCLIVDYRYLKKKKLRKEARICKGIGYTYIIGGVLVYIIFRIF
ncbi:CLC_0170 family protein [Marinisporobacter balticus]